MTGVNSMTSDQKGALATSIALDMHKVLGEAKPADVTMVDWMDSTIAALLMTSIGIAASRMRQGQTDEDVVATMTVVAETMKAYGRGCGCDDFLDFMCPAE